MVPLRHGLANGDVGRNLSEKGHEPPRLLSFCTLPRAQQIRQWINLHERVQATEVGRRLIDKEARQANINLKKITDEDWQRVASDYVAGERKISTPISLRQMVGAPGASKASGQTLPRACGRFNARSWSRLSNACSV